MRRKTLSYLITIVGLVLLSLAYAWPMETAHSASQGQGGQEAGGTSILDEEPPAATPQPGTLEETGEPEKAEPRDALLAPEIIGILDCNNTARIMPLGDSITAGVSSGILDNAYVIGYRKDLWDSLKSANYRIDFAGGVRHGWAYKQTEGFDPDHEGHGGWHAKGGSGGGIGPNIATWLAATPADIVLLHIGTNDIGSNGQDAAEVDEILEKIDSVSQDIPVILALIVNRVPYSSATAQYNADVKVMAQKRIDEKGDKIVIVDMENGAGLIYAKQPEGDMWDDKHPFATGYTKMAKVWKKALVDLLPVCARNDSYKIDEDSKLNSFNVLANDQGEEITITSFGSGSTGGSLALKETRFEYTPAADFFGTESFTYTINNGPPGSVVAATVTVTVKPVNDPPTAGDDFFEVVEDTSGVFDVLANDTSEPDADETLTILNISEGSAGASLKIIDNRISYIPAADFFGTETFTYTINDGTPGSNATARVMVDVTPENDPPWVANPGDQLNAEGELVLLQIEAGDPDGNQLSYFAMGLPQGLEIYPDTGLISGKLTPFSRGSHTVQVIVSDGDAAVAVIVSFKWQVEGRYSHLFMPLLMRNSQTGSRQTAESP